MLSEESDFTLSAYRRVYLRCSLPTAESNCTQSLGHCFLGNCAYFTVEIAPLQSLIVFLFTWQVSYVSCSLAVLLGNSKVGWKTAESCLYREVGLHWVMHAVYGLPAKASIISLLGFGWFTQIISAKLKRKADKILGCRCYLRISTTSKPFTKNNLN